MTAPVGAPRRFTLIPRNRCAPPVGPFDLPQFPRRGWRILGRWKRGDPFLVVLGVSETDAIARLRRAFVGYSRRDLESIVGLWLERWYPGCRFLKPRWIHVRELGVTRLRFLTRWRRRPRHRRPSNPPFLRFVVRKGVAR